jgi:hypothetical protein
MFLANFMATKDGKNNKNKFYLPFLFSFFNDFLFYYSFYITYFSQNGFRKTYHSYHLPKNWKKSLQTAGLRLFLLLKMEMEKSCHSRH